MKKYLFVTDDIYEMGGMQCYVNAKAQYMNTLGWNIYIVFAKLPKGKCTISTLQQYSDGGIVLLDNDPCMLNKQVVSKVVQKVRRVIGYEEKENEIIVESHSDKTSLWGEIIAENVGGKHFCLLLNEIFRGYGKCYENHLDFYEFKYERHELAGIDKTSMTKLFEGYRHVEPSAEYVLSAMPGKTVQDIESAIGDILHDRDYTIGYIGRLEKKYVPTIFEEISSFAKSHPAQKIQFVIIGDFKGHDDLFEIFKNICNIEIVKLGILYPIPLKLIKKLDAVVAGSGSAYAAAWENIPTIVVDAINCMPIGVLGHTTNNSLYNDSSDRTSYQEMLEDILVKKRYEGKKAKLEIPCDANAGHSKHMVFLGKSEKERKYFPLMTGNEKINYKIISKWVLIYSYLGLRAGDFLLKIRKGWVK